MNCSFCQKTFKTARSLSGHQRLCKMNPSHDVSWLEKVYASKPKEERVINNQYTKAKQEGRIHGVKVETRLLLAERARGQTHSAETKAKLSVIAKNRNLGGHTSKTKIWFQKLDGSAVFLQSSYELRFATLLEESGVSWTRPAPLNWQDEKGNAHKYYPDFKIGNIFFDTKNSYLAVKDAPKIKAVSEQNGVEIRVVLNEDINEEYIKALQA